MMRRTLLYVSFFVLPLLPLQSCQRTVTEDEGASVPLFISNMDTKALGSGDHTYRVVLRPNFTVAVSYLTGTYSSLVVNHSTTSGCWLSPCRVNNAGEPLTAEGNPASTLQEAASSGIYTPHGLGGEYYLTVVSPAVMFNNLCYDITPATNLAISDPVLVSFYGDFLSGYFIYPSNTSEEKALPLKDRSARLFIRIECGDLAEANIQQINILNRVNSARYHLYNGYLNTNYTADASVPVFNYVTDNAGNVLRLVKASGDYWATDPANGVFFPAIPFNNIDFAELRPRIEIIMGSDPLHPTRAVVSIDQAMEPMKNYTYTLLVSKSQVNISLTAVTWDNGGTWPTDDSETQALVGTVNIEPWDVAPTAAADGWNGHF